MTDQRERISEDRPKVHDYHWALWATACREGVSIGYPRITPFYTPPKSGKVWDEPPPAELAQDDYRIADQIAKWVIQLERVRPHQRSALVIYWGAYPGAPFHRPERYAQNNIDPSNCRKSARRGMRWVAENVRL